MPYTVTPTAIPDVLLLEPKVYSDDRGYFFESYKASDFQAATGLQADFVQDNHSLSTKGVLRGLHYQIRHPQGKLLRVVHGSVFDVAVDLRKSSPSFGRWVGAMLSAENRRQLWIPPGFAHGFLALSDNAEVVYKITDTWYPEHERTLLWNDPALAIAWPLDGEPRLAPKDVDGKPFNQADLFD
jgi:dTDP-4-dehydrorhamnose 3,5-epimerase